MSDHSVYEFSLTDADFDRIIAALSLMQDQDEAKHPDEARKTRALIDKLRREAA